MRFDDEKELENIIIELNKINGYCKVVDEEVGELHQQFNLPGYGIIDLLGVSIYGDPGGVNVEVNIYELKNTTLKSRDVAQISRYYRGVCRYIENIYKVSIEISDDDKYGFVLLGDNCVCNFKIRGILVGSGYSDDDVCYLVDSIPWLECYHFKLTHSGIDFKMSDCWYSLKESKEEIRGKGLNIFGMLYNAKEEYERQRLEIIERVRP